MKGRATYHSIFLTTNARTSQILDECSSLFTLIPLIKAQSSVSVIALGYGIGRPLKFSFQHSPSGRDYRPTECTVTLCIILTIFTVQRLVFKPAHQAVAMQDHVQINIHRFRCLVYSRLAEARPIKLLNYRYYIEILPRYTSLVPRPLPAFRCLHAKSGRAWYARARA